MEILRLALIGLPKNARRALPLLLSIMISVYCIHIARGYVLATFEGLKFSVIHGGVGHLQIGDVDQFGSYSETTLQHGLDPVQQKMIAKLLEANPEVKTFTRQAGIQGLVSSGERTIPFQGLGVEEGFETPLMRSISPVVEGRSLNQGFRIENRVLIGKIMADQLEVSVDDFVTIVGSTETGGINAIDADVVGTFTTGVPIRDSLALQLPLEKAQEVSQSNRVSKFIIFLNNDSNVVQTQKKLQDSLSDSIRVAAWTELDPFYFQLKSNFETQFTIFSAIIYFIAFLAIFNASTTAILERTYQIGIFRSLGFSSFQTRLIFFYEIAVVVSIGLILGVILSYLTIRLLDNMNVMLPPPPGRSTPVPLNIFWDLKAAVSISLVLSATSILATALSSQRVMGMQIINAIKKG